MASLIQGLLIPMNSFESKGVKKKVPVNKVPLLKIVFPVICADHANSRVFILPLGSVLPATFRWRMLDDWERELKRLHVRGYKAILCNPAFRLSER